MPPKQHIHIYIRRNNCCWGLVDVRENIIALSFFFRFVLRRYRVARRTYSRGLIEKGRGGGGEGKKTPRFPIRRFAKTGQYVLFVRISRRRLQNIFAIYGAASNNAGLIYGVAHGINGDKANLRNIFNASRYTRVRLPLDFDSRSSFSRRFCMHSDNYRGFFKSNVFYSIRIHIYDISMLCEIGFGMQ